MVEKCLVRGVLTNFSENVPFWGPYIGSKYFSYLPLNLSRQGAFPGKILSVKNLSYQKQQKLAPQPRDPDPQGV